jgi:hypothetical protein
VGQSSENALALGTTIISKTEEPAQAVVLESYPPTFSPISNTPSSNEEEGAFSSPPSKVVSNVNNGPVETNIAPSVKKSTEKKANSIPEVKQKANSCLC